MCRAGGRRLILPSPYTFQPEQGHLRARNYNLYGNEAHLINKDYFSEYTIEYLRGRNYLTFHNPVTESKFEQYYSTTVFSPYYQLNMEWYE